MVASMKRPAQGLRRTSWVLRRIVAPRCLHGRRQFPKKRIALRPQGGEHSLKSQLVQTSASSSATRMRHGSEGATKTQTVCYDSIFQNPLI